MPRHRLLLPDTRPSWRDPNCPVIGKSGRLIDFHKMEEKAKLSMALSEEPTWKNDPTYNLRKDKP